MTVRERILARVEKRVAGHTSPCWLWQGRLTESGYARFSLKDRETRVHRASYEAFVGPIPPELVIDHLCRNRSCVNPTHLEPVSTRENVRRGERACVTHCPRGHEYTPENTYICARGTRSCRECRTIARRRYLARREGFCDSSPDGGAA